MDVDRRAVCRGSRAGGDGETDFEAARLGKPVGRCSLARGRAITEVPRPALGLADRLVGELDELLADRVMGGEYEVGAEFGCDFSTLEA